MKKVDLGIITFKALVQMVREVDTEVGAQVICREWFDAILNAALLVGATYPQEVLRLQVTRGLTENRDFNFLRQQLCNGEIPKLPQLSTK